MNYLLSEPEFIFSSFFHKLDILSKSVFTTEFEDPELS